MAASLTDAEAIAGAVSRYRLPYGTAFDQRHHPAHAAIRAAIGAGAIGTPTALRIVYTCWVGPDFAADNWRVDRRRAGGGALIDLAPHGLDLATYLLGDTIEDVRAFTQRRVHAYDVDDGAMLIGRTQAGALIQVHVAYNTPEMLPRRRLEIVGTQGQITADRTMGQTPGGEVWLHNACTGACSPLPVQDAEASPFARQMAAFARFARGEHTRMFDVARDLHTMRLLARAYAEAEPAPCR